MGKNSTGGDAEADCGPFTDPKSKECSLPYGGRVDSDSSPRELSMDKMIQARMGEPTSAMSQMGGTKNSVDGFRSDDGE